MNLPQKGKVYTVYQVPVCNKGIFWSKKAKDCKPQGLFFPALTIGCIQKITWYEFCLRVVKGNQTLAPWKNNFLGTLNASSLSNQATHNLWKIVVFFLCCIQRLLLSYFCDFFTQYNILVQHAKASSWLFRWFCCWLNTCLPNRLS
jgi:hypothetical protein